MGVDNSIQFTKRQETRPAHSSEELDRIKSKREDQTHCESERAKKLEPVKMTERGLRTRIARYTLQGLNVAEIDEQLKQESYGPPSKVLTSGVRANMRHLIDVMIEEGIIDEKVLERYRKRCRKTRRD